VAKCAQRLECLGAVDELSACIGLACALLREPPAFGDTARLAASLGRIQDELSGLCADLATPVARGKTRIAARHVTALERHIDAWTGRLPTLRAFIRPGGSQIVLLAAQEPAAGSIVPYLNRLADALFVAARYATQLGGREDIPTSRRQDQRSGRR
jgi:cob(I)alamin adenosyltransferase